MKARTAEFSKRMHGRTSGEYNALYKKYNELYEGKAGGLAKGTRRSES